MVPDDAINQLPRYRDALIHHYHPASELSEKTRPVFGAYALYPGFYDQTVQDNPYQKTIEEVGIGAFSLLPAADHSGSHWLKLFLQQKLGLLEDNCSLAETDQYFVEEAIRIPYKGTSVSHYTNLTIAVTVSKSQQEINFLYPIITVEQKKRSELTIEQTGKKNEKSDKVYWFFTLGSALKLNSPVIKKGVRGKFEVKLTHAAALSDVKNWSELPQKYPFLRS